MTISLEQAQTITADNVSDVVDDGYVSAEDLCADGFADECEKAGIK